MLVELHIKNYALIDDLVLEFGPGLNVITGETGAGKSIITKAIEFVSGSRTSSAIVKSSADYTTVEASFDISSIEGLQENLYELGIDTDEDILILRRTFFKSNRKSRAWINGYSVSLRQLQQISNFLLSFSGQHEQQMLLNPDSHMFLLDAFSNCHGEASLVRSIFGEIKNREADLKRLEERIKESRTHLQDLENLYNELTRVDPKPHEASQIRHNLDRLKHSAFLHERARNAYSILYESDSCVHDLIAMAERDLMEVARIDSDVKRIIELLEQAGVLIDEVSRELQDYTQKVVFDPEMLAYLENRLALLEKLASRIGCSVDELHEAKDQIRAELNSVHDLNFKKQELVEVIQKLWLQYNSAALKLSEKRKKGAERLSRIMGNELAMLEMPHAKFLVDFIKCEEPSEYGLERAVFLFSANPGEPLKPLNQVVSGGELSRIFLVMKALFGQSISGLILIFDEIDTGLGAGTSERVGQMLKKLSKRHQIICITHQAQIAAMGDYHFQVSKKVESGQTSIVVRRLSKQERIDELSRMLSGREDYPDIRKHAESLLIREGITV